MPTSKTVHSDTFPLEHEIQEMTYRDVYAAWLEDKSPNKGSEQDFLARKLADGWRISDSGNSIWRPVNNLGLGTTNQPAPNVGPEEIAAAIKAGHDAHYAEKSGSAPEDNVEEDRPKRKRDTKPLPEEREEPLMAAENAPPAKRTWLGGK